MMIALGNGTDSRAGGLTAEQRDAIGTWRWLGWRGSTPAFKASIALLGAVLFALGTYGVMALGR